MCRKEHGRAWKLDCDIGEKVVKPLYLCAGMPRSGSTWLYNVVRILCQDNYDKPYTCWVADFQRPTYEKSDAAVVKVHGRNIEFMKFEPIVLTCHRDLRDVAASLVLKRWNRVDSVVDGLSTVVPAYWHWAQHAVFDFEYEDLLTDPVGLAREVIIATGLSGDAQAIVDEISTLSNKTAATYDKQNLLHHNHSTRRVSGYHMDVLPPEVVQRLETVYHDYFTKLGYL